VVSLHFNYIGIHFFGFAMSNPNHYIVPFDVLTPGPGLFPLVNNSPLNAQ